MSSSGLIYAVIVGAWAAYLVPMWLRRQDELNEARPTERFSTAIRLLSGRAGMERRYARDLRARSAEAGEPDDDALDVATEPVDVRAFAMPPGRPQGHSAQDADGTHAREAYHGRENPARDAREVSAAREAHPAREVNVSRDSRDVRDSRERESRERDSHEGHAAPAQQRVPGARRTPSARADSRTTERAQRSKALARRRRTTVLLFLAFTFGAVVAAVGGLAFLWAPGVPAVLLSAYIAYLRSQEHRRFAVQMDRQRAEVAAQRLKERVRQPHRRASASVSTEAFDVPAEEPEPAAEPEDPGLLALAADRRALVEQTDHAEWVDQQRERQRRPEHGDSWDPVPVPLPTYVTAPVAPRATSDVDLGAPDTWSSARSSAVAPDHEAEDGTAPSESSADDDPARADDGERSDARRAASARRSRERGRTPLFDQYEDGDRPRAANE
ncbi:gephyrin-like molybdotransferase receptor GlpR [Streptomyces acidiscabies]|uniref:gephyrin-like molybdotransferase receptor GlpR n=1 Tax=Streptomyces acidiscabies TaxID=42234 RepID=UPI000951D880|nr:gephyrin-like molybdotransferase receptor GlpR [Streptomyces acidiscabies]